MLGEGAPLEEGMKIERIRSEPRKGNTQALCSQQVTVW